MSNTCVSTRRYFRMLCVVYFRTSCTLNTSKITTTRPTNTLWMILLDNNVHKSVSQKCFAFRLALGLFSSTDFDVVRCLNWRGFICLCTFHLSDYICVSIRLPFSWSRPLANKIHRHAVVKVSRNAVPGPRRNRRKRSGALKCQYPHRNGRSGAPMTLFRTTLCPKKRDQNVFCNISCKPWAIQTKFGT